jgi:hypothetical protein
VPSSGTIETVPQAALARATARCPSAAYMPSPPNGAVMTGTASGMPRTLVLVRGVPIPGTGRGLITQRANASRLARSVCSVPAPLSRNTVTSGGRLRSAAARISGSALTGASSPGRG